MIEAVGGAVLVALIFLFARVPGDVAKHDRLTRERDDDLDSWLADRKVIVDRELKRLMDDLASRNLLFSGERLYQRARIKEGALHLWRDEERSARRFVAGLDSAEGLPHQVWRRIRRRPASPLATPDRASPLIEHWREAESYEGSPVLSVDDPTKRTLDGAIGDVRKGTAAR